jgi:hypothetical protein
MSKSHGPAIRALLRQELDGLTLRAIADELSITPEVTRNSLLRMPDAYIDRWQTTSGGPPAAVWCVVVPPENCPHPWRSKPSNTTGAQA